MKDKISKVIFALLLIALIIFSCVGIFAIFNGLVAYKAASGNDWIGFLGGILGSAIAGLIAVITFRLTIKNTNENQEKAHKLQISLKVEDNLNRKFETERSVLATTYNQLENFLYSVSNMLNQNDNYIEMKNDFLRLYKEVISSINNIKFNSEIFDDRSYCENCQMCEIKTYGTLVKSAADIQREILVIDEECRVVLSHLEVALNTAAQSKQLMDESSMLKQMNINNEQIIAIRKSQIINPIGSFTTEEANYYNEIISISNNISANNKRMAEINSLIDSNLKIVGEQSSLARNKAVQINAKNKTQLDILIKKYLINYNQYIRETVYTVQKNGKKLNNGCAKLDFEKNHKAED